MPPFTLILNAGGQSRRMGQDKALLRVPHTGQPLLGHMLQRLQDVPFDQVIVITNRTELVAQVALPGPVQFIPDRYPAVGPLGGIATGLALCTGWALVLACDLPLINPEVVQMLATLATQRELQGDFTWEAIVPQIGGYAQPLHACYHPAILPVIVEQLAQGTRRASGLLAAIRTRWVTEEELRPLDPHFHSFFNTNTPAEWAQACALLEKETANSE